MCQKNWHHVHKKWPMRKKWPMWKKDPCPSNNLSQKLNYTKNILIQTNPSNNGYLN